MSRVLTSSKLIDSIRKRAMIPDDTSTFEDQDILDILNEEIDAGLLATIMSLNEEHLVTFEDEPLTTNKNGYKIPYRAVGNKLRDVAIVTPNSSGTGLIDEHYELSRISLEELSDYRNNYVSFDEDTFYVQGNQVFLVQSDARGGTHIRMYFYLRPNSIVLQERTAKVIAIDTNTGVVSLDSFPDDFANLPDFDFIEHRSPNKILSYDISPSSVDSSTRTITFTASDIPDDLKVGDYVCIAEETPVPNIPTEYHPLLAQRAAVHILEAMGDTEGLSNATRKLKQMEDSIMQITDDRVEGAPQKINPRHSTLVETTILNRLRRRRSL